MSVRQLKDGTWICEYYEKVDGKNKHRNKSFGKGPSAELAAQAMDNEIKQRKIKLPKAYNGPLFKELVSGYLKEKFRKTGGMSESDQTNTFHKLEANILPYFGKQPVPQFNKDLLDGYIDLRSNHYTDKKKTKKIKMTTIHRELSIVKAILNWAVANDPPLIKYNPVALYKMPKRDDEIILPPTKEERQRIYNAASPHVKRFIVLNYNCGARSGKTELLRINWEHVDLEGGVITVISSDKGGPKLRRVPISDELHEHLTEWRKEDAEKRKLDDPAILAGPIVHYQGKPIDKINKAWRATLTRAKITRRIRPYDLRHAFATDLLEEGADLKAVSKLMGHSREDTTIRVYRHVTSKSERAALNKLPRAVKKVKLRKADKNKEDGKNVEKKTGKNKNAK